MNFLIPVLIGVPIYSFCYYQNNKIDVTKLEVKKNIKEKIRIVQISDLHSKEFGKDNNILRKMILEQTPDVIVATGDIIDSNLKNKEKMLDFLISLNKEVRVIYIPGNNEYRTELMDEFNNKLKRNGVVALKNEIATLNIKGYEINFLGLVEDLDRENMSKIKRAKCRYFYQDDKVLFNKLEAKSGIKIVLSHYPENFALINDKSYNKYNFDLMFSGHAHGGQFIIPGIGGLFAPGQGILPKYYSGIYGEKNKLIVSRGLGNSGFPLRLFNKPNIIVLDLV
ncbi:metallophosphoesterase [Clostridium sp.]|uniref:metallophosphoesterase n=1 Tax=Clostridium sp. TaxID=1506 RepID=UPI003F34136F